MTIKVLTETETQTLVHPKGMLDMTVGIIVGGPLAGALLARHRGRLTLIGANNYAVDGWERASDPHKDMRVRVLKRGERVTLEVQ